MEIERVKYKAFGIHDEDIEEYGVDRFETYSEAYGRMEAFIDIIDVLDIEDELVILVDEEEICGDIYREGYISEERNFYIEDYTREY